MTQVAVYGRPGCMQCKQTVKALIRLGVEHTYLDIDADEDARALVEATGILTLPVVVAEGREPFGGFSPDRLQELAA